MNKKIKNLISGFPIFSRYPITKEFTKFCLVGFSNLFLDLAVYLLLTRYLHIFYLLAGICSFVVAMSWSFFVNRQWTFRHQGGNLKQLYLKFFIANAISMVANLSLLYIFVDGLHINDILSKFLVAVVVAFLSFSLNKFWTFGK